jgi:hypothetical protein
MILGIVLDAGSPFFRTDGHRSRPPARLFTVRGIAKNLQLRLLGLSAVLSTLFAVQAHASDAVDVSKAMPDAKSVSEGLFPEESCEQ